MEDTHWLLRIGDGINFINSIKYSIWGIKSYTSFGKHFIKNVKKGDKLWFVKSRSKGLLLYVSTFVKIEKREVGPLINLTKTNEEFGWENNKEEDWDIEVHYVNLYNIEQLNLLSNIKTISSITKFNSKCEVNLPMHYLLIEEYSKCFLIN